MFGWSCSNRVLLRSAAACLLLGWITSTAYADNPPEQNPHLWQPKTRSVAVFKNGLGFFTQQAAAELHAGWCYAAEVPPAAFGTLAIYSTTADQSVDLVGAGTGEVVEFDGQGAADEIELKRQKLEACRGLTVQLDYRQLSGKRQASGKLLAVGDQYAVIEADQQTLAVPLADVRRLQLPQLPLRVHVSTAEDAPAERAELAMSYLRSGILWIPEYTLQLIDEQTAELTLRGTLVNEAEDLIDCDVNFVVGVPHFVHSDLMSPVSVGLAIRSMGSALPQQGVPPQMMNQIMNRAVIANNYSSSDAFVPGSGDGSQPLSELLNSLPRQEATGASDFTVYTKKNLTVRRGERAMVTLLTQRVPYSHRYRWETGGPIQHFLTLQNSTEVPWTTGPCLALSDRQPLSEDMLKYTPVGSQGELQVTTAINVAHDLTEQETDRQLKAHEPRNNEYYDLVTISGTLQLKSFEKRPVEMLITTPIVGLPKEASDEGKIRVDARQLRLLERAGTIEWQITLQPGETRSLHYAYQRYVPSS